MAQRTTRPRCDHAGGRPYGGRAGQAEGPRTAHVKRVRRERVTRVLFPRTGMFLR
jgi:hypothetical protein